MSDTGYNVRVEFPSLVEMLDLVQAIVEQLGQMLRVDEDSQHWVEVAVRESVINAIKHGNGHDAAKTVELDFTVVPAAEPTELRVRVRDHGNGFDPASLPDPLAPENMLKASGRGIFVMRSFMDEVRIEPAPGGGMAVFMRKRFTRS
jgi:serine/threonine-protein kinase RsbW